MRTPTLWRSIRVVSCSPSIKIIRNGWRAANDCLRPTLLQLISRIHAHRHAAVPAHDQISPDEWRQIAVAHPIRVAALDLRPVVLDDSVRLPHVGPDLRPEVDVQLRV